MTPELAIGDRAYSSWSMRGWLLFDAFNQPVKIRQARMYTPEFAALLADFAPARLVPAVRFAPDLVVWDSLAIAETLHERHPEAGYWPADPATRAKARALTAEMHSGYGALREDCTMNLRASYADYRPGDRVQADLDHLAARWSAALEASTGPWLFGACYSIADVFFAPIAGRLASYGLSLGGAADAYAARQLAHPSFRRWRAMGMVDLADQPVYARPQLTQRPWPGPAPIPAKAAANGPSVNAACPFSGKPVTDFAEIEGRIWGFCNPFCRDKVVADPEAWPAFMALLRA